MNDRQLKAYVEQLQKNLEKAKVENWIQNIVHAEESATAKEPSHNEMERTRIDEAVMKAGKDHEDVRDTVRGPIREEEQEEEEGDDKEKSG